MRCANDLSKYPGRDEPVRPNIKKSGKIKGSPILDVSRLIHGQIVLCVRL